MCGADAVMIVELYLTRRVRRARAHGAAMSTSSSGARYVFRWNRLGRKGQRCRVTARGTMNSCRLEFDDGFVMITSRNAIKRAE